MSVVVQAAFLVSLLAGEAVTLFGEAAEAGLAVGRVLLAVDPGACVINDQIAAAEMIAQ